MPSLITLMENRISSQLTVKTNSITVEKRQNKLLPYAPMPIFAVGAGALGFDKFQREMKSLESSDLWGREFTFRHETNALFKDLVNELKNGKANEMPNCLIVEGKNHDFCEKIISWIGKSSGAGYERTKTQNHIITKLEKAEKDFSKTKKWNLVYIENMDKLINHNISKDKVVEAMTGILSSSAERYHTTIIFTTKDTRKLDKIIQEPQNGIKIININHLDQDRFFSNEKILCKNEKLIELLKTNSESTLRNKKILKYTAVGLAVGTVTTTIIKAFSKNKNQI